ncbi:MAG: hypothetical protein HY447_00435, partial [Candidatus Omnitrophica bacterium]|nr:hypothetical protein [Candidatus Omnitrophota bacterium]
MTFYKARKLISLFIVFTFLLSDLARANPSIIENRYRASVEAKIPLDIALPSELGTVQEYDAPRAAPLVVHIQTAHTHYESAQKVKGIIHYLQKHHKIKLLFVEGASESLHPEFLQFFEDPVSNAKMIDELAQRGELTGVDLSLANSDLKIKAIGIENPPLYRAVYQNFKKVIGNLDKSESYLQDEKTKLDKKASLIFSRELRKLVETWNKFNSGHRDLLTTLRFLRNEAKEYLKINFEDPFSQFEWPELTRLTLLQELQRLIDQDKLVGERKRLIRWLRKYNTLRSYIQVFASIQLEKPRSYFEGFYEKAYPKGFRFKDYPQVTYWVANQVLQSE